MRSVESLPSAVEIDGRPVPLEVVRHPRAKRLLLRVVRRRVDEALIRLTVPERARLAPALAFLESRRPWLAERLARLPERRPFVEGAEIPVLGRAHRLVRDPAATFELDGRLIRVGGDREHLTRRTTDGLKALAREELGRMAEGHAARIGRRIRRVTVRETRSRWGSCSSSGALSFSWRLILAPEWVADYVAAHEVAHLIHHDHSPAFWALCDRLASRRREADRWLDRHGQVLHAYG